MKILFKDSLYTFRNIFQDKKIIDRKTDLC